MARSYELGQLIEDDELNNWLSSFFKKNIFFHIISIFADLDFENLFIIISRKNYS